MPEAICIPMCVHLQMRNFWWFCFSLQIAVIWNYRSFFNCNFLHTKWRLIYSQHYASGKAVKLCLFRGYLIICIMYIITILVHVIKDMAICSCEFPAPPPLWPGYQGDGGLGLIPGLNFKNVKTPGQVPDWRETTHGRPYRDKFGVNARLL